MYEHLTLRRHLINRSHIHTQIDSQLLLYENIEGEISVLVYNYSYIQLQSSKKEKKEKKKLSPKSTNNRNHS